MPDTTDKIIPPLKCSNCQNIVIQQSYERQSIRLKINGPDGIFPNASVVSGDTISLAFRKNSGNWTALDTSYSVSFDPPPGKKIILYTILKLADENIQE